MKTTQLFLVLLGATCALAHFKSGGNFPDDEKNRHDTCKPLVSSDCDTCSNSKDSSSSSHSKGGSSENVEPPMPGDGEISGSGSGCQWTGENSGSGEWEFSGNCSGSGEISGSGSGEVGGSGSGIGSGSGVDSGEWEDGEYCFLLQIFLQFSLKLEIEIRQVFIEWINVTQTTIVANPDFTEFDILVELWYSLQILFEKHPVIKQTIEFLYIGEWGYVCDLEGLALDIQTADAEITLEQVIEIDVTTGSCPLLAALEECKQNATASEQQQIEVLIGKITVIIEGEYSFGQKLVLIYKEFSAFFTQHAELKSFIFSFKIEQFGLIQSYFDICAVYWRIDNFELAVGGAPADCALLDVLDAAWQNTSMNLTTRQNLKQLFNKTFTYFETEVSVEVRIKWFTEQVYQLLIVAEWDIKVLYSLEIKGYGSIYDLIYAYIYCTNNGVGPGDFTEEPTTTVSTSTSTTTSTTTTTTTTTTPTTTKPSTTAAPVCANAWKVNVISNNITLLLSSIDADQNITNKWTTTEKNTFLGYKKKIYNISANTTTTYTHAAKFADIKQVLLNFAGSSTTVYKKVHAVYISTWGYVSAYCACASSGSTTSG